MQDFYLIVNWFVALALLGLGLVALLGSRKLALNRLFALFTATISIWIVASYISNDVANSPRVSVIGNYFVFLFIFISGYLLLWFAIALADDKKTARLLSKLSLPILAVGATSCTPLVVAGAKQQGTVYAVEFGPLTLLYIIGLLLLLIWALVVLHKNIKITQGRQKEHMVVLYRAMGIALPILVVTEFILPAATGWFGLTNIGILAMAIPVVSLYYSVIKLKLFNLRLVVVRSLAYVLTLAIIGSSYSLLSYYLTTLIKRANNQIFQKELNVVLIGIAISVYPTILRQFRRLTNKLFYRDAYDAQELFDSLNHTLVSSLDLNYLLKQVSAILVENLKSEVAFFVLKTTGGSQDRVVGSVALPSFDGHDVTEVHVLASNIRQTTLVADLMDEDQTDLKQIMDRNNIAVLVQLVPNVNKPGGGLGHIILGPKKSGNPYTSQDIRVLDTVANELIIAIQNALHFEEIQNFNLTLQAKVDEATRKMRRTNEKLKALDETKDDFISMASHQLRTPLTSVKGYISMVLEQDAGKINDTQREMLGQAFFSSQRMVYLISDLLNVSRLKTGKFVIDATQVDLVELVQQELHQLEESAASRSLTLTFEAPKDFPTLMFDETKTRQIIMNFVDNAIYYTPAGGHIIVRLVNNPSTIELRVEDDGIGVPKADQHHLFTKFYRAGNARQARPDGTGLGLFMAKKVIAAQGGSTLFSSNEGKGSMFGFVFSKAKLQPPDMTTAPEPTVKTKDAVLLK